MAKKPTKKAESAPVEILSDKEIVLKHVKDAKCAEAKPGLFNIILESQKGDIITLHSGLAKSKDEAWKLAAHAVL